MNTLYNQFVSAVEDGECIRKENLLYSLISSDPRTKTLLTFEDGCGYEEYELYDSNGLRINAYKHRNGKIEICMHGANISNGATHRIDYARQGEHEKFIELLKEFETL